MKTIRFSQHIQAPRATVWHHMLDAASYRDWTSAFCEGSYYEGSWAEGAELRFLSPGGQGILSQVVERQEGAVIRLRHQAELENFQVKPGRADDWCNTAEDYLFHDEAGGTRLDIEMQVTPAFEAMLVDLWPKALLRLKTLCETPGAP